MSEAKNSESFYVQGVIASKRTEIMELIEGVKNRMKKYVEELLLQNRRQSSGEAKLRDLSQQSRTEAASSFRQAFETVLIIVQVIYF